MHPRRVNLLSATSERFKAVNNYSTEEVISWIYCFGICIERAAVLTRRKEGFQTEV
jgi:hypothetical protein